ncbi:MAG: D-tyrosyl-tRNA(Tyr) deacylase [Ignavibacteria bacterium]|nr:D-tyrosyl-tRNA(Tyr) deacylase [Bacteroidota bacterium]MSQ45917.1 D-tyrosyl-tRNA(Tyr) deacylase [Ignavibacteria bacterium]
MKALIQKVSSSSVSVNEKIISSIGKGLLIFLGVSKHDTINDAIKLAKKCCLLRIFEDENNKMNRSLIDVSGEIMIIPQFTLYAETIKGLRPSFELAAPPEIAEPLYQKFIAECKLIIESEKVKTGIFREMMKVSLVNDGPVTILVESETMKI